MDSRFMRGIMITASILLATTVLTSSATVDQIFVTKADIIATRPGITTVPRCRRGTMRPEVAVKCWVAIVEVPFCVFQIVKVFDGGSVFTVGKACCHAFLDLTDDCKIEVFQHAKFFPVIEKFCVAIGGGPSAAAPMASSLAGNDQAPPPEPGA